VRVCIFLVLFFASRMFVFSSLGVISIEAAGRHRYGQYSYEFLFWINSTDSPVTMLACVHLGILGSLPHDLSCIAVDHGSHQHWKLALLRIRAAGKAKQSNFNIRSEL